MIGTVLKHRYEILEKIGEGNLFNVYRCEDKINNRQLAVKVLLPQYASNRMFAERILVEAQAMVGITHPGIVEVFDCGEENGTYFVVTEYVRGVDLKERIRRSSSLTLSTSVDVGIAICDVLDFAHRRGFIHGDLRPGNIMVTSEGQIKLANFWVSNAVASSQPVRASAMMRSVHYMSPEVAEGKAATPASDIYSLGVILFELLTGSVPYDADTPIAIALKHSREPIPSIRTQNPGVPKTLEAVVARAMQKSPDERFRSVKSMLIELKSVHEALHLSKPLVWSNVGDAKSPEPLPDPDEEPDEIEEARPVVLSALRTTLLIMVILAAIAVAVFGFMLLSTPPEVRVPDLVGRTMEEAQALLPASKIQLAVKSEQFNEDYPAGQIYFTHPSAGRTVRAGKTIEAWVSKGSKFAITPNATKMILEDAQRAITEAGLNVGQVSEEYSDIIPAGNITSQSPAPGTRMERGQAVNLVYSLGPKPEEAPLDTPEGDNPPASTEPKSYDVKFTVPDGPQDQTIEIRVEDDGGDNIAYTDIKHPGDKIEQTVQGIGKKVVIRIYINDKLVRSYTASQ